MTWRAGRFLGRSGNRPPGAAPSRPDAGAIIREIASPGGSQARNWATNQAGPRVTLPFSGPLAVVALAFPEPPPSHQTQETAAQQQDAGGHGSKLNLIHLEAQRRASLGLSHDREIWILAEIRSVRG